MQDVRPTPLYTLVSPDLYLADSASAGGEVDWIGADGQLTPLRQDEMSAGVGQIRQVWVYSEEFGEAAWNGFHQVALRANIADAGDTDSHDAILLLTPTSTPCRGEGQAKG